MATPQYSITETDGVFVVASRHGTRVGVFRDEPSAVACYNERMLAYCMEKARVAMLRAGEYLNQIQRNRK